MEDFVIESNRIEGIFKTTDEQIRAHYEFMDLPELTIADVCQFVRVIQPDAVLRDKVGLDVQVGGQLKPRGGPQIRSALQGLLGRTNGDAWQTHVTYELLHPFTDGNGRSGRAIWLWIMGGDEPPEIGFLHTFYYQTLSKLSG